MEGKVNNVVRRKKEEEGFSYICKLCKFDCVGRKGIMKHLKEEHQTEWTGLLAQIKGDDAEAQLVKLVSNADFVEPEKKGVKGKKDISNGGHTNGVAKAKVAKMSPAEEKETKVLLSAVEKTEGRKDYPVSLDVLRMIDARTTNIPNYGSLVGRIARLLAVVVGKEKKKDGEEENGEKEEEEEEEGEVTLHCYKCDMDLDGSYPDIMPHLEAKHGDFVNILGTIFPPAKKRMAQFVEKAATKFELVVPTEKDVQRLVIKEKIEKQKERDAIAMKRKLEWEETRKVIAEKKRKLAAEANAINESERRRQERDRVKAELKKTSWSSNGSVRKRRLEKRLEELREKIKEEYVKKNSEQLEKRTKALLENLSPKQLRKLCMNYFEGLNGEKEITWTETLEAIKMEEEYSFVADFLILLHDYARVNSRKSFKFGHMLITSKQAELIFDKGMISLRNGRITDAWRIPSSWDIEDPDEGLGEDWNRKDDSRLIIGAVKFGRNLAKIISFWPAMKKKVQNEEGKVKKPVKQRFAILLNVYYNRGKYNEEFGLSLFSEDVDEEEEIIDDDVDDDVVEIIPEPTVAKKNTTASKEKKSTTTEEKKEDEKMEEDEDEEEEEEEEEEEKEKKAEKKDEKKEDTKDAVEEDEDPAEEDM